MAEEKESQKEEGTSETMTSMSKEQAPTALQTISNDELRKMATFRLSKTCAYIWTILYSFAFPFLCYKTLQAKHLFSDPTLTYGSCLVLIAIDLISVLVIPFSLALMWKNLKKKNYERMHFFGALPLVVFIMYILVRIEFLDLFLTRQLEGVS